MPYTCCVPGCRGNYKTGPKVRVFGFPPITTSPDLHKKWINNIKRENFQPNGNHKVCERHFIDSDYRHFSEAYDEKLGKTLRVPLKVPLLKPDAVPTQFPDAPLYISSKPENIREGPEAKLRRLEEGAIAKAIAESNKVQEDYINARSFLTLAQLKERLHFIDSDKWKIEATSQNIVLYNIQCDPVPRILSSIVINSNLEVSVFVGDCKVYRLGTVNCPQSVGNINEIITILDELDIVGCSAVRNDDGNTHILMNTAIGILKNVDIEASGASIPFLVEQLELLTVNCNARRYSAHTMIFASLLFSLSPQAYRFTRQYGNIILPHETTIHSLTRRYDVSPIKEARNCNFLAYAKKKFSIIDEKDRLVNLLVDEVYLKKYWDYKGGNIVGVTYNLEAAASSAHVFMVSSILSACKDVVHILPTKTVTGENLHSVIRNVIVGLEDIGYKVISVVTDNNRVNSKAMSFFASPPHVSIVYPHPGDSSRPLFFVLDTVHILKCIRNLWLNQKNEGQCMIFPSFLSDGTESLQHASLGALKLMQNIETDSLAKYGYSLSVKALAPTNLERQNVRLALQIFNVYVCQGLMKLGKEHGIPHYEDTASYIDIILKWWQIVNVQTPFCGLRNNCQYQMPLTNNPEDRNMIYLNHFMNWVERWEKHGCTSGKLSKETFFSLKHSTYALTELVSYCCDKLKLKYILPGKFQTDQLESRFSMYRQLAGSQFYISLRQLYECEEKLRLRSHFFLQLPSEKFGTLTFDKLFSWENACEDEDSPTFEFEISEIDFSETEECLPVLVYVAGYCAFSAIKKFKCDECRRKVVLNKQLPMNEEHSYIKSIDRGRLVYPQKCVVRAVVINYIVICKLCTDFEQEFLKVANQRSLAVSITKKNLKLVEDEKCTNGHKLSDIIHKIVWSSTNCFLNNYCKKLNDHQMSMANRRKLQTYQ